MAWQWRAKKEIAQGWKWMRQQNPDATAEAERWAEENKEEMKDVDRILYVSVKQYQKTRHPALGRGGGFGVKKGSG